MEVIELRDTSGKMVVVSYADAMAAVTKAGFKIFGMDNEAIACLRKHYMYKGGPLPITRQSVDETFKTEPAGKQG